MPSRQTNFACKAFLSHRYKSPELNLYFFEIFTELAEVQFEVDVRIKSTDVTRLERAVRSITRAARAGPLHRTGGITPREDATNDRSH